MMMFGRLQFTPSSMWFGFLQIVHGRFVHFRVDVSVLRAQQCACCLSRGNAMKMLQGRQRLRGGCSFSNHYTLGRACESCCSSLESPEKARRSCAFVRQSSLPSFKLRGSADFLRAARDSPQKQSKARKSLLRRNTDYFHLHGNLPPEHLSDKRVRLTVVFASVTNPLYCAMIPGGAQLGFELLLVRFMPERIQKPVEPAPWGPKQGDGGTPRSPDISRPDTKTC